MRKLTWAGALIIAGAAALCLGPWRTTSWATQVTGLIKLAALATAAAASLVVWHRHGRDDPQRRPWLLLGIGLVLYAGGQAVLAYHQVILRQRIAFPSYGDPLFVAAEVFLIAALIVFSVVAFRSGLPLGSPGVFWRPALLGLALFVFCAYPLLAPIVRKGGPAAELFLNVYYPVASFLALAPCLVLLRVGLQFRGGRLLGVWVPITAALAAVFVSDVLFAYVTALDVKWAEGIMDLLYVTGYVVLPRGMLAQLDALAPGS